MEHPRHNFKSPIAIAGTSRLLTACTALMLLVLFSYDTAAQSPYQLKAAVLGNLAKFVEWPADSFASRDEEIRLGILGEDPFGTDLDTILKPIKANGRSFTVIRSRHIQDLTSCHMIFCPVGETDDLREVIKKTGGKPILLVGEGAKFLEQGGMINFHLEDRKVRFAINADAAEKARLTIHPQLLKLATSVMRKERNP